MGANKNMSVIYTYYFILCLYFTTCMISNSGPGNYSRPVTIRKTRSQNTVDKAFIVKQQINNQGIGDTISTRCKITPFVHNLTHKKKTEIHMQPAQLTSKNSVETQDSSNKKYIFTSPRTCLSESAKDQTRAKRLKFMLAKLIILQNFN